MTPSLRGCFVLLGVAAFGSAQPATPAPKAVLVTGASTGIGRKITERLAADGYFVYATARKPEDLKALGALKNVQALPLDVHPDLAGDLLAGVGAHRLEAGRPRRVGGRRHAPSLWPPALPIRRSRG